MRTQRIVTANTLHTGTVVYLDARGRWVEAIEGAVVVADDALLRSLQAAAQQSVARCEVTSVYALDVRVVDDHPVPLSVRELIRAAHAPTA